MGWGTMRQSDRFVQAKNEGGNAGGTPRERVPLWNRLPQLLNLARYRMQPAQSEELLDYEPIHLHVFPCDAHPLLTAMQAHVHGRHGVLLDSENQRQTASSPNAQEEAETGPSTKILSLTNFKFLLDQVPAVRTIEFSGKTDPFQNPELMAMINTGYKVNGAEITVVTDGLMLDGAINEIVCSNLHTLVVRLHSHRPSLYALLTENSPERFVALLNNVQQLVKQKKSMNSQLEIELQITLDLHTFREIPEIIRFAEELGVDGIRFENYFSPKTGTPNDRTLYSHHTQVVRYLRELSRTTLKNTRLLVTLPVLLDQDMSNHRNCRDPFTTVSVDAELTASPCSRQQLIRGKMGKIWEADFWNNDLSQWLRQVHGSGASGRTAVPLPCRTCTRNIDCTPNGI